LHWAGDARDSLNAPLLAEILSCRPRDGVQMITSHLRTLDRACFGDSLESCRAFRATFRFREANGDHKFDWGKIMRTFVRGALGISDKTSQEYVDVNEKLSRIRDAFRNKVNAELQNQSTNLRAAMQEPPDAE
jgi:hypothetical protein